jgi:hypothetical protein
VPVLADSQTLPKHTCISRGPDLEPRDWGLRGKYSYDRDGYVRTKKAGRLVGEWYLLVSLRSAYRTNFLIRGTAITDVKRLEALRWRLLNRYATVICPARTSAWGEGEKLGRIFWRHREDGSWNGLEFHTDNNAASNIYFDKMKAEAKKKGVIDELAVIPRGDQIEAGERFHTAELRCRQYSGYIQMINAVFWEGMRLSGRLPDPSCYTKHRNGHPYRVVVNGRTYIFNRGRFGTEAFLYWPEPGHVEISFDE